MSLAFGRKVTHASGSPRKCRIPQRVCSGTHRPLPTSRDVPRVSPMSENGGKIPKQNDTNDNNIITASHRIILCQETSEQKIPSESGVNPEKLTKGQINELDSNKANIDPIELKASWKVKKEQFDKMRDDLKERQGTIMEVYADLKTAEEELALLGQKLSSHATENDLQIMNVAKLTPRRLLELCGETKACSPDVADKERMVAAYFNVDVEKISNIPSRVIGTCEEMLQKHKELIDLFESLQLNESDLLHSRNGRKINDFKVEYDALKDKVQAVKTELAMDLVELTDVIRKCVKETMAVSLRNKNLTSELSRLNSKNSLPPKQIHDKDHVFKQHPNKIKIEELEKIVKEEKLKNLSMKERLKKFESEAKMNENRAVHLEGALEQAREEYRVLERTIQNQRDQSQQEFNEELCKLTNSIEENSKNLEKIVEAKTKLQNEKEELEIRLKTVLDEKMKLQNITHTQQSRIIQKDEQYQQTLKILQDTQVELAEALKDRGDTVTVPQVIEKDLEDTKAEIENLHKKTAEKNKLIQKMKERLHATKTLEDQLRNEIEQKAKHIENLKNKCSSLEDRTKESEVKMQFYQKQIMTLEEEIKNVKNNYYREKGNLDNLNSTVTEQKQKIQELTQCKDELTMTLHNQAIELKACTHTILTQEEHIKEKDALLSELTKTKTKQTSIIESLQRDLASKVNKTDSKVNGNLYERDPEIESLIVDIRTKENRISEMEKVMIALYYQARKTKSKNKKYREKINVLKQVLSRYETYIDNTNVYFPSEHLDSLLKILENEL
ncbi:myosin-8-like [Aricia agestis]|uniref:myosin-8-like n=1 Tax=Aricia agestis TaxID=91739 RepID=UPI001C206FCF|nr:myosin-8-like [Aricia agestis]